jgi:hypothetical protein
MNKKIFFFLLLIIILLYPVYSLELSASPGNLDMSGKVNEKICRDFIIKSDYNGNLISSLKWLKEENHIKNINYYTINSSEINILEELPDKIKINRVSIKKEICLSFQEPGDYNGALIIRTEDSYAGVGLWINAKISGTKNKEKEAQIITGLSILNTIHNKTNKSNLIIIPVILTIVLITILLTLLLIQRFNKNI